MINIVHVSGRKMSDNKMSIQISLSETEVRTILAQHIATNLGSGFSVHPRTITFELENVPGQIVGNEQRFKQVTAKAVQNGPKPKVVDPWDVPG